MRLAVRPKPSCSSTLKCFITDTVCTPRSAIRVPWSLNRRNRSVKLSQKSWGGSPLQLCALNPVSSKAGELHFYTNTDSDKATYNQHRLSKVPLSRTVGGRWERGQG